MTAPAETGGQGQEFYDRLRYWQAVLQADGQAAVERFGDQMIDELDALHPAMNEQCDFAGDAISPDLTGTEQPFPVQRGRLTEATGIYNGMQIITVDDRPELWHEFIIHHQTIRVSPVQDATTTLKIYTNPDDCSIVPHDSYGALFEDTSVPRISMEDIHGYLTVASDTFAAAINSKPFLNQPHETQLEFVENYLGRFEHGMTLQGRSLGIGGTYFYRVAQGNPDAIGEDIRAFNGDYLRGQYLSLGFLGHVALGRAPFRRRSEISDRLAGLCLVVAAEDHYPDYGVVRGDILYVPISSQNIEVIVINGAAPLEGVVNLHGGISPEDGGLDGAPV